MKIFMIHPKFIETINNHRLITLWMNIKSLFCSLFNKKLDMSNCSDLPEPFATKSGLLLKSIAILTNLFD